MQRFECLELVEQVTSAIDVLMTQQSRLDKYNDCICSIKTLDSTASSDLRHTLVMPWYENVADHLRRRSSINRSSLILDIATALKRLHSIGLFHGNLRLENVIVTDCGRVCLTDVGVNTLALRAFSNSFEPVPSAWMYKDAEELLSGIRDQRTDVYSFASMVYAMYTSDPPFQPSQPRHYRGLRRIIERGHLQLLRRPEGMDEHLWALVQKCWNRVPAHRPTMAEVEIDLRNMQRV